MAPSTQYSDPEIVDDDAPVDSGVDAAAEDEVATSGNEQQQAKSELQDLDTSNIIDDSKGVSTRGAKSDPMAADKEIDAAVGDAEKADESS